MGDGRVHGSHHSRPSGLRHPDRQRCRHWPLLWPQHRSATRGVPQPEKPGHRGRQTTLCRFHQKLQRYLLPCPLPLRLQQSPGRGPLRGKPGLEGDMRSLPQFRYHEMPPDEPRWSHLIVTHSDVISSIIKICISSYVRVWAKGNMFVMLWHHRETRR